MLQLRKGLIFFRAPQRLATLQSKCLYSKKTEHKEGEHDTKPEQKTAPEEDSAAARLNKLLASMQTDSATSSEGREVSMAKPGEKIRKKREDIKAAVANKDIFVAAKRVAELLDGKDDQNTKKSEIELLSRLLNHKSMDAEKDKSGTGEQEQSLQDLMTSMKIDRNKHVREETTRADHVKRFMDRGPQKKRQAVPSTGGVNLYGDDSWTIFKNVDELREVPDLCATWQQLEQKELKLLVTHSPQNYFEKIARWTEKGRVWQFPINNEQGMDEEREVDFTEHIFLEQHLEGWCPTKGPIRHFMELVCVGLSKNPFISAQEKKEHILWYREYFENKKDILKDLMHTMATEKKQKELNQ